MQSVRGGLSVKHRGRGWATYWQWWRAEFYQKQTRHFLWKGFSLTSPLFSETKITAFRMRLPVARHKTFPRLLTPACSAILQISEVVNCIHRLLNGRERKKQKQKKTNKVELGVEVPLRFGKPKRCMEIEKSSARHCNVESMIPCFREWREDGSSRGRKGNLICCTSVSGDSLNPSAWRNICRGCTFFFIYKSSPTYSRIHRTRLPFMSSIYMGTYAAVATTAHYFHICRSVLTRQSGWQTFSDGGTENPVTQQKCEHSASTPIYI